MSSAAPSEIADNELPSPVTIAADVGGTFTDIALIGADGSLATYKLPSTPQDYAVGIIGGIQALCAMVALPPAQIASVLHGCTIATNAILERKGARVALVTTRGFRDVLELRRIRVPKLYDPFWLKPEPLVPRRLRLEITERIGARGEIVQPLATNELDALADELASLDVEAIAVCFINAHANADHERVVGARLRAALPDCFVTLSSELLPEIREYERTSTTVVNGYVGPVVKRYVGSLRERLADADISGRLMVMQSSGGMLDAATVETEPARIIECGPAAGVIGALELGRVLGLADLITLDMGGTTAKASMVEGGRLLTTDEYEVGGGISVSSQLVKGGGYALKTPVIDISEVGAGGGSIVRLDKAGQIKVGPESAGAAPGPAAYARGGAEPTVTDANIVLGYLNPRALAGGSVPIDAELARAAIEERIAGPLGRDLHETAYGIHVLANASMMRAVRSVSTYRGRDPRAFALVAFGGNGGIHGIPLARTLGMKMVIVPAAAGVFSALGLLAADMATSKTRAFLHQLDEIDPDELFAALAELEAIVRGRLGGAAGDIAFRHQAALRYVGQAFELAVPIDIAAVRANGLAALAEAFEREHERTYGHRFPGSRAVQTVSLQATGSVATAGREVLARAAAAKRPPPSGESWREAYFGDHGGLTRTRIVPRAALGSAGVRGPLIIEDDDSTIVVPPDASVSADAHGHLTIVLDGGEFGEPDAQRH